MQQPGASLKPGSVTSGRQNTHLLTWREAGCMTCAADQPPSSGGMAWIFIKRVAGKNVEGRKRLHGAWSWGWEEGWKKAEQPGAALKAEKRVTSAAQSAAEAQMSKMVAISDSVKPDHFRSIAMATHGDNTLGRVFGLRANRRRGEWQAGFKSRVSHLKLSPSTYRPVLIFNPALRASDFFFRHGM